MDGTITWPEGFSDIGGKTFEWCFNNKKTFVLFTLEQMHHPTKIFKLWQNFCKQRINDDRFPKICGSKLREE